MRGPIFKQLIENRSYNLDLGETIEDLEKMYTLLIEARGKTISTLNSFDENISLISLCQFSYPSKTPKFSNEARQLRKEFIGISTNIILENQFRNKIKSSFKTAINLKQLNFGDIRNLFYE